MSSTRTASGARKPKAVFDLTGTADYSELRLRQLTKYSRLNFEAERDTLQQEIAELQRILGSDASCANWSPKSSQRSPNATAPTAAIHQTK